MASATFQQGVAFFRAGRLEDALKAFNETILHNNKHHVAYDCRAAVREKLGEFQAALQDSKKVISLTPDQPKGYMRAARLASLKGKSAVATEFANMALVRLKPSDQKRRAEITAILDASKARMLSVTADSLPVEIVQMIFQMVVSDGVGSLLSLTHVCARWRRIALDIPSLWMQLHLTRQNPVNKTKCWLERSKRRLDTLVVECDLRPTQYEAIWAILKRAPVNSLKVKSFPLYLPESESTIFRLQSLRILPQTLQYPTPSELQLDRLISSPPLLTSLHMENLVVEWRSFTSTVQHSSKLTSLILRNFVWSEIPRGGELLSLILKLRSLQTLVIDVPGAYAPAAPSMSDLLNGDGVPVESVDMDSLTNIELGGQLNALAFVQRARTPSLRVLRLFRAGRVELVLAALAPSCATTLTELRLRSCPLAVPQVLLVRFGSIEILEISHTGEDLNSLVEMMAAGTIGRSLTELDLSHSPNLRGGPLVRLVKSRISPPNDGNIAPPVRLMSLTVNGCPLVEPETLPWIRQHVEVVSCVYMSKAQIRKAKR